MPDQTPHPQQLLIPDGDDVVWSSCVSPEKERVIVAQESLPGTRAWLLSFDAAGEMRLDSLHPGDDNQRGKWY